MHPRLGSATFDTPVDSTQAEGVCGAETAVNISMFTDKKAKTLGRTNLIQLAL